MDQIFKAAEEINKKIPEDKKQNANPQEIFGLVSQHMMTMLQNGDLQESMSFLQQSMGSMGATPGGPTQQAPTLTNEFVPKKKSKVSFNDPDADVDDDSKDPQQDRQEIESVNDSDYDDDDIQPKTNDLHYTMNVKLSDLYLGKKKKIAFKRTAYQKKDGKYETFQEKKKVVIPIIPGTKHGEQITFKGESDRKPGHIPGDVIITISEEPDETFIRDNNNLLIIKDISLSDNYLLEHTITHLDGRKIKICSKEGDVIVSSTTNDDSEEDETENKANGIRKITGEGMPIKNSNEKGDLYIRFNLKLPQKLSNEEISKLKEIIPSMNKDKENNGTDGTDGSKNAVVIQLEQLSEDDFYLTGYDEDDDYYSDSDEDEDDEDEEDEEEDDDEYSDEDGNDEQEDPLAILGTEEEQEAKEIKDDTKQKN